MASEGRNKAAKSLLDLQPTAVLELFVLYPDFVNQPSKSFSFHSGSVFTESLVWNGVRYLPIPVETEGFGIFGDGTLPRPKIKVSNANKVVSVLLQNFNDLKNGVVFRIKVFVKHLDHFNFDAGNPFGTPDGNAEISREKYLIGQKVLENYEYAEFELNLPTDLDNFEVNPRSVNAKYCYWNYRGLGCMYAGKPIETANCESFKNKNGDIIDVKQNDNDDFDSAEFEYDSQIAYAEGQFVFLYNKKIILGRSDDDEPIFSKTWYVCVENNGVGVPNIGVQFPEDNPTYWVQDSCSKKIQSCKRRFNQNLEYEKFVGSVSQDLKFVSYRVKDTKEGIQFATQNALFTGPNGVLTYKKGSSKPFTITGWIRSSISITFNRDSSQTVWATSTAVENEVARLRVLAGRLKFHNKFTPNKAKRAEVAAPYYEHLGQNLGSFNFVSISWDGRNLQTRWNDNVETYQDVNYTQTTANTFFSLFNQAAIGSNYTSGGVELRTFRGDIAQTCIWNRNLTSKEIDGLRRTNKSKFAPFEDSYMPLQYEQCIGSLDTLTGENNTDGGLIAWYDMDSIDVGGNLSLKDKSNNAIHLTSYGDVTASNFKTVSYSNESIEYVPSTQDFYFLPFGGFPGTDGYDYNPR